MERLAPQKRSTAEKGRDSAKARAPMRKGFAPSVAHGGKDGGGAGANPCVDCRAGDIECGGRATGELAVGDCPLDDGSLLDVWRLEVPASRVVSIVYRSTGFDPFLTLVDAACELITSNDDCVEGDLETSCITLELTAGTYFIFANSFAAGETGEYEITVDCVDFDPCRDCVVGTIGCGESASGELVATDCAVPSDGSSIDLWRIEIGETRPLTLELASAQFDSFLVLFDADCDVIAFNDDCGTGTLDSCLTTLVEPGEYFVGANSFSAGETGSYRLDLTCLDLGPCRDCLAGEVSCGDRGTGAFRSSSCVADGQSRELWRLDLPGEQSVRVDFSFMGAASVAILDDLCRPARELEPCDPESPCMRSVALPPGTHFLDLRRVSEGVPLDYEFQVECRPFDPLSDCVVGEVQCNAPAFGTLAATDCVFDAASPFIDVWSFTIDDPRQLTVSMRSQAFDTVLVLVSETGVLIASNDDCGFAGAEGTDSCLSTPLAPGRYFFIATSFSAGETGPYSIDARCDEIRLCRQCDVGSLRCGETVAGALSRTDCRSAAGHLEDVWRLALPVGGLVRISLTSAEIDPVLRLFGESCSPIAVNDDCGKSLNSCLDVELDPGEYFLHASSFASGEIGSYRLSVDCPDFEICSACEPREIECGRSRQGVLTSACVGPDGTPTDLWRLEVPFEAAVTARLRSSVFDAALALFNDACAPIAVNDDCDDTTLDGCVTAMVGPGTYFLGAGSIFDDAAGAYSVTVECAAAPVGQLPGDSNQDGELNVADTICLLRCMFVGDPPRLPCGDGTPEHTANRTLLDSDGDGSIGLGDAMYLFGFLFLGTDPPVQGTRCIRIPACDAVCTR